MSSYKDLEVYRLANANALALYKNTRGIRGSDNLSLRSQATRGAFSISTNIVEGSKADSAAEFARFVQISINSSWELEHHLENLEALELLSADRAQQALKNNVKVRKMLCGLRDYLKRRQATDTERKRKREKDKSD